MFLLRCAFWLSIVYSALFWRSGYLVVPASLIKPTSETTRDVLVAAASKATLMCAKRPAECLDTSGLTSLVQAATDTGRAGVGENRAKEPSAAATRRHVARPVTP